jgi:hypothetical protein
MALSPNLALPFISASQAQKHVTHNEAIAVLDTVTQLSIESMNVTSPLIDAPRGRTFHRARRRIRSLVQQGRQDRAAGNRRLAIC